MNNFQLDQDSNNTKENNSNNIVTNEKKRKRRSKHELNGRNFECNICGKAYLSQPALNNHKNTKHANKDGGVIEKRSRGRPRKYLQSDTKPMESETIKLENFFSNSNRKKIDAEDININDQIKAAFEDIFVKYASSCYMQLQHYTENPLLQMLLYEKTITTAKAERNADEIFYEYLTIVKDSTNKSYFSLVLKFILLFRECLNLSMSKKEVPYEDKKEFSQYGNTESLPELCNEFVADFLEPSNYFGIESESDRCELIELIQHFCYWLFKNDYTKSKLTLSNGEA